MTLKLSEETRDVHLDAVSAEFEVSSYSCKASNLFNVRVSLTQN